MPVCFQQKGSIQRTCGIIDPRRAYRSARQRLSTRKVPGILHVIQTKVRVSYACFFNIHDSHSGHVKRRHECLVDDRADDIPND